MLTQHYSLMSQQKDKVSFLKRGTDGQEVR